MLEFIGYFLIGGIVVSLTTYYGAKGDSFLAAFISQFPSMTVLIFFLMYTQSGKEEVISYAKNFVYTVPPWILYVVAVVLLCERIGIWWALATGVTLYVGTCMLLAYIK
ncbi:MAG: DUF3147 domain-containing protein [Lentisphaerae bacterium]|nr:DUF3147 domain-containing protein [Lentisphaerota bacterium]